MTHRRNKNTKEKKHQAGKAKTTKGISWRLGWQIFVGILAIAGLVVGFYELINYFRSDTKTFYTIVFPGLGLIAWVTILILLIKKKSRYTIPLLAITIIMGIAGGIGYYSYYQAQKDKVTVLVAQFDGPEQTYGLRNQIIEDLRQATKKYKDTPIIDGKDVVTPGQGSEYAQELGKKVKADLVIWGWYKPTDNPNITIHFENLSPTQISILNASETYQPEATISDLESFKIQHKLGSEVTTLVSFIKGLIYAQAGDYKEAIDLIEPIRNEKNVSTYIDPYILDVTIGNSYLALRNYDKSFEYFDRVLEQKPNFALAYNSKGTAYWALKNYDLAIQFLTKSIDLEPNSFAPYNNRALAYIFLNQPNLAIKDLNKSIELNPNIYLMYHNLGVAHYFNGNNDQALVNLDKALQLNPNFALSYATRGSIYSSMKEWNKALKDLNKAIKLDPQLAVAFTSRGAVYIQTQKKDLAIPDLNKAIELDPTLALAYVNRATYYELISEFARATDDLNKAIELDPKLGASYFVRGNIYFMQRNYDLAMQDFNKSIELTPKFALAYFGRSQLFQAMGNKTEAEADLKRFRELNGLQP
jgi:tetratricopeptide (TPR) repeat protein